MSSTRLYTSGWYQAVKLCCIKKLGCHFIIYNIWEISHISILPLNSFLLNLLSEKYLFHVFPISTYLFAMFLIWYNHSVITGTWQRHYASVHGNLYFWLFVILLITLGCPHWGSCKNFFSQILFTFRWFSKKLLIDDSFQVVECHSFIRRCCIRRLPFQLCLWQVSLINVTQEGFFLHFLVSGKLKIQPY